MSCICGKVIYTNNSKSIVPRSGFGQARRILPIRTTHTTATSTPTIRNGTTTTATTAMGGRFA